ncbi:hypothetical protein E3N88_18426 [Mikania micrantha]|uniref:Uncharacterized protein n=1 Tax=Mikania micrantha TaxID=192012 RepID=A0A5N6NM20_9ASTR|nr:hypothetical protein E3N88_18426 [Mikania micrantha]
MPARFLLRHIPAHPSFSGEDSGETSNSSEDSGETLLRFLLRHTPPSELNKTYSSRYAEVGSGGAVEVAGFRISIISRLTNSETLAADLMDFHSLTRRELQSLCKLNKIPANITNIAMADALKSLQIVVGIETADLGEKVEASHTRCRTSTRQKAKTTETETLPSTVSRTTRRGRKQLSTEVEDSNNNLLQTPVISNVSHRLSECTENEAKQVKYSTRRSTRLTENKSAAPIVAKAVELDFLDVTSENPVETEVEDICNAFEKLDVLVMEEEETTHKSGVITYEICDVKAESDGISSPSEEATQNSREDDVDYDEVINNLKQESHETSNLCEEEDLEDNLKASDVKYDLKPDSDDISSPCEDEDLGQKLDLGDSFMRGVKEDNHVMAQEQSSNSKTISCPFADENLEVETFNVVKENNFGADDVLGHEDNLCAEIEIGHEDILCVQIEITNQVPEYNESGSIVIDDPLDEITINEMEETSENNTADETIDVIPIVSTIITEDEDIEPAPITENNVSEKFDAESCLATQNPLIFHDAISHLAHATSIKKATPLTAVSDDKENIVDECKVRKEKDEMKIKSVNEMSIRQLKKQLKALTLKTLNSKLIDQEGEAAATRPALQPVCENQMMVGTEAEN